MDEELEEIFAAVVFKPDASVIKRKLESGFLSPGRSLADFVSGECIGHFVGKLIWMMQQNGETGNRLDELRKIEQLFTIVDDLEGVAHEGLHKNIKQALRNEKV